MRTVETDAEAAEQRLPQRPNDANATTGGPGRSPSGQGRRIRQVTAGTKPTQPQEARQRSQRNHRRGSGGEAPPGGVWGLCPLQSQRAHEDVREHLGPGRRRQHFAAMEQPGLSAGDLRTFVGSLDDR
jgi:hypothetical protein